MPDQVMDRSHLERDTERAAGYEGLSYDNGISSNGHSSSWDILAGIKKFEQEYDAYDAKNASEALLAFADGDVPKNKVSASSFLITMFGAIHSQNNLAHSTI